MKFAPSIAIPLGFEIIKSALLPTTSILPLRVLFSLEFILLTISFASPLLSLGFAWINPPILELVLVLELLIMVPLLLVLNLEYSFMDMPLLFGFTMSIWIALFGVFKMVGWLEMGRFYQEGFGLYLYLVKGSKVKITNAIKKI